jgi:UDP-N-acetylglucosamine 2-epimerase
MKILSIVGARPQFIKAAPLSRELRRAFKEVLVHTGQHYDYEMSPLFFKELSIPEPDYNLGIGSGSHAQQTGRMIIDIEKVLTSEKPNLVLVYGDTNSTMAGAIAAAKMCIPVGHVEAGARSFNRGMPEEINRIVADHVSTLLFCSTSESAKNLEREGISKGVFLTGDVMYDALLSNREIANRKSKIIHLLKLKPKNYVYATVHRAENTDKRNNLRNILEAFGASSEKIVFPVHPRTKKMIKRFRISIPGNIKVIKPVGYLDSLSLQANAKKVLTDSGGMQKEAYFLKVPCITLRNETEWVETVRDGRNILVGSDKLKIIEAIKEFAPKGRQHDYFGSGDTAEKIINILRKYLDGARL